MKTDLVDGWVKSAFGEDPIRETSGNLVIEIGGNTVTHVSDIRSRTVRNDIRVSLYPLGLWIASSWWRLAWEPAPSNERFIPNSWRMAHELSAAGHGYSWRCLTFASDRVSVEAYTSRAINIKISFPVRFFHPLPDGKLPPSRKSPSQRHAARTLLNLRGALPFRSA